MKSSYFYRLLQIDHIRKPGDLPDEQQLADSFVLIFHLKGEGRIDIQASGRPLQKKRCILFRLMKHSESQLQQLKSAGISSGCSPIAMTTAA